MSKLVLENVKVVVNGVTLSGHAFNVDTPQTRDEVDVSGFGSREYKPGLEDSSLVVQFVQDFASASVHATLEPLFRQKTAFVVYVQPDSTVAVSATNPAYGGSAQLYEYNGLSGGLNSRAEISATFRPTGGTTFAWGTAVPT
jgi:hypothetical protein